MSRSFIHICTVYATPSCVHWLLIRSRAGVSLSFSALFSSPRTHVAFHLSLAHLRSTTFPFIYPACISITRSRCAAIFAPSRRALEIPRSGITLSTLVVASRLWLYELRSTDIVCTGYGWCASEIKGYVENDSHTVRTEKGKETNASRYVICIYITYICITCIYITIIVVFCYSIVDDSSCRPPWSRLRVILLREK